MIRSCQMVSKQVQSLRHYYQSGKARETRPAASKEICLILVNFKEFESCLV